jgi:proteasome accessory factor B
MQPLERLINLVALLLETRRPLSFDQIRERLPAYDHEDPASAKRMFERDKDLLRDNGIPVEVVPTDPWEVESGYIIPKDRYYVPQIAFTDEELSALFVAALSPGEDTTAEQGVRKLLYGAEGGILVGRSIAPVAAPDAAGGRLTAVADAVLKRRRIRFRYRTSRGSVSDRDIDPWGLVWRAGHWYVVGLDHDRTEVRAFRLSRLASDVEEVGQGSEPPKGFRASDHIQAGPWGQGEPADRARIAFSPEVAWWALAGVPGAETKPARADGWIEATVPYAEPEGLVSWALRFGPDAELLGPEPLREEAVRRLEELVG